MLTPQEQALIAEIRANADVTGESDDRSKSNLRRGQRRLLAIIDRLTMPADDRERRYAKDIADWCHRSLDTARATGNLETRPFVQNVELIIKALRAYASGPDALAACRLLVKWHGNVFDGGKQALRFDNGYPVDRTDVDEAARLAKEALGPTIWVVPAPAPEPTLTDAQLLEALLCDDCPPPNQFTDGVRCATCPRRSEPDRYCEHSGVRLDKGKGS